MKKIRTRVPENLDIDRVIEEHQALFKKLKLTKSKLLLMLEQHAKSRAKIKKKNENNEFVPLDSRILKRLIHNYKSYIRFLDDTKILKVYNSYSTEGYCKTYKYYDEYLCQCYREYYLNDKMVRKTVEREYQRLNTARKRKTIDREFMYLFFEEKKLAIDKEQAIKWIYEYTGAKILKLKTQPYIRKRLKRINSAMNRLKDVKALICRIDEKDYLDYTFSGSANRFYHIFTTLNKDLRKFLTYEGEPLVEIDLKNSHPFFLLCLLNPSFWKRNNSEKSKVNIDLLGNELYELINNDNICLDIIMCLKSAYTKEHNSLTEFTEMVLDGSIYDFIQEHFVPVFGERFNLKGKAKVELLTVFYSNPEEHGDRHYGPCMMFKAFFPEVYHLFQLIHKINKKENILSRILLRLESLSIIELVCKKLHGEYPHIPFTTLHDSIITTKGNEAIVEQLMKSEIHSFTGNEPSVDYKHLTDLSLIKNHTVGSEEAVLEVKSLSIIKKQEQRGKAIVDTCTGEYFYTINAAAEKSNMHRNTVSKMVNGIIPNTTCLQYAA